MRAIRFLLENSLFLIFGAIAALIWANVDNASYQHFVELPLAHVDWIGHAVFDAEGHLVERHLTLHFLVNDILMALFFAIAGKEVWEATLPGGPLNNPKQAAAPLIATLGGMAGPALVYVGGAVITGHWSDLSNGWAIPTATDIAFSYLVARLVFGAAHPAIPFLLLLAIADDALGLIIIAIFYPSGPIVLKWMLLPVAAIVVGLVLRRLRIYSFWPYLLICGPISWIGFHWANLHPALGLLPIIPVMPHAHVDTGLFDWSRLDRQDTLSAFEHWFKNPVELILGLFGLCNAGVQLTAVGAATWLVLAGLLIGKPLGIVVMGTLANRLGFKLPKGMSKRDLFALGCAAGIGFTVAIFVSSVAFRAGPVQDAAKIGALLSFAAAGMTWVGAKLLGVRKMVGPPEGGGHGHGHGHGH
ncbi:MAG: Na+/H+ antiporter NhaA [Myxococcales bacterium]|nr:Na+/H+ antiporter NhaA [Myxococcales bacterium]